MATTYFYIFQKFSVENKGVFEWGHLVRKSVIYTCSYVPKIVEFFHNFLDGSWLG